MCLNFVNGLTGLFCTGASWRPGHYEVKYSWIRDGHWLGPPMGWIWLEMSVFMLGRVGHRTYILAIRCLRSIRNCSALRRVGLSSVK